MQIFVILSLATALVAVVFSLQNLQVVSVRFLLWHFDGSLALVLLLSVAAGVVASLLASVPSALRRSGQISKLKRRVAELESAPEANTAGSSGSPYTAKTS